MKSMQDIKDMLKTWCIFWQGVPNTTQVNSEQMISLPVIQSLENGMKMVSSELIEIPRVITIHHDNKKVALRVSHLRSELEIDISGAETACFDYLIEDFSICNIANEAANFLLEGESLFFKSSYNPMPVMNVDAHIPLPKWSKKGSDFDNGRISMTMEGSRFLRLESSEDSEPLGEEIKNFICLEDCSDEDKFELSLRWNCEEPIEANLTFNQLLALQGFIDRMVRNIYKEMSYYNEEE